MYDIAVIGSGPAGLSAALNGAARNKKVVVFARSIETSSVYKAERIENHLGMPGVTGKEMAEKFYEHVKSREIEFVEGRVLQIMNFNEKFMINCENNIFEAATVVLALGVNKAATIKNEDEYVGKGVSYCATCDGALYRNRDVFVVGEISEADEDVNFLKGICSKVYYYCKNGESENGSDENIEMISEKPVEILGNEFVTGISLGEKSINCEAVFIIKESMPLTSLVQNLEMDGNFIKVNRLMETNIKGLYASGDCTGWPFQISKAIGEGQIAALQASRFLEKQ